MAGAHLVPYQVTPDIRSALVERYGAAGEKVRRAEAFELYEYAPAAGYRGVARIVSVLDETGRTTRTNPKKAQRLRQGCSPAARNTAV